ncbi:RNA recognition motif. (a.k.a. RRM, RBD, or RNP domain) [Spirosomataceae bacterium TFI 002]|nr:RNA recognition motif. (a.k.a. RRM, RBD, or RNP domain) [Spirosomataceae bacterium TFI 002]
MDIHVSNLPFKITDEQLIALFAKYGKVESVNIIVDRRTKLKKGFGFVKMPKASEAQLAVSKLNGVEIMERQLKCEFVKPKGNVQYSISKSGKQFFKKKAKRKDDVIVYGDQPKEDPKPRKKRRGAGRGTTY